VNFRRRGKKKIKKIPRGKTFSEQGEIDKERDQRSERKKHGPGMSKVITADSVGEVRVFASGLTKVKRGRERKAGGRGGSSASDEAPCARAQT